MGLRDLEIAPSYESTENEWQLVNGFYNAVLSECVKYYRIAGFFSSSALSVAMTGIRNLVRNKGKMYLLISPELSEEDYLTIQAHGCICGHERAFDELVLDDAVVDENLRLLAWLLDNGNLEIKIVVGKKSRHSLFHQKIGICQDAEGDMISFSGSINETAQAWLRNIEEFKVFKSWEDGQNGYFKSDLEKFFEYWENRRPDVAEAYDIPASVREKIVRIKPRDVNDLNIMREYKKAEEAKSAALSLFPHQLQAVGKWRRNNFSLLMEMATGTGKTRTALGCLVEKLKENKPLLTIVATPQNTLSRQWRDDLVKLKIGMDKIVFADGSNSNWASDLPSLLFGLKHGHFKTAIVFTTHVTASSSRFVEVMKRWKKDVAVLFICDEVHAIGSLHQRNALLPIYDYRIGLSATPERMFDNRGTSIIRDYFGDDSFEFTIADALHTINPVTGKPFLNNFRYYPIFVPLSAEESYEYEELSVKIRKMSMMLDRDEEVYERLLNKRADISKNAENKIVMLNDLISDMKRRGKIQDTILFVSDKQIDECLRLLAKKGIARAKITEEISATSIATKSGLTERQKIIEDFKDGYQQILLGIKCLDEGIDIPNARIAILLSNSTNPREYIQRVGRVIRQAPNKEVSKIYDFIVTPSCAWANAGLLEKEGRRAVQIARNALNFDEVKEQFIQEGVDIDADQ